MSWATDYFQVIHGPVEMTGELTVTGDKPYGAWEQDSGDNVNANPATGDSLGFLTQAVSVVGPTFEQMSLGYQNIPAKSGTKVSIGRVGVGGQIEVEDLKGVVYNGTTGQGLLVTSGTGDLSAVAAKTEVSFKNGRLYAAQTGDTVHFYVSNPAVTPLVDTVNNVRVRLVRVQGYIK